MKFPFGKFQCTIAKPEMIWYYINNWKRRGCEALLFDRLNMPEMGRWKGNAI